MDELFDLPPVAALPEPGATSGRARPRLQRPDREQVELRPTHLDALLPPDHRARVVWEFVEGLDLAPLHARIRAVEGHPGRPPIDPAILVALWLYATLEGVGSARALARLVEEHDAYRWIAGGVGVNHHTLADARVTDPEVLAGILTASGAALGADGLVTLERVALDGMRVRAAAGDGSFRRRDALERALDDAEARVAALRAELEDDPAATSRRVAAARERAARERTERVRAALGRLPGLEAARRRARHPPVEQRASTTDPDARVMKMAGGGYRAALNAQLATDTASGVIVGADVIGVGSDHGSLAPLVADVTRRFGRAPAEVLADGGFLSRDDIGMVADAHGTLVYLPPRQDGAGPSVRDHPAVAAWRARMATDAAKGIYRQRAASAELSNAQARNRGLQRFTVRGVRRARSVLVWFALAHNLLRARALRAAAAGVITTIG